MTRKLFADRAIKDGTVTEAKLASAVSSKLNDNGNTVTVRANSESTQNAVALNFINTSSISVTVAAGSTGNANISFASSGGGTPDFVLQSYGIT